MVKRKVGTSDGEFVERIDGYSDVSTEGDNEIDGRNDGIRDGCGVGYVVGFSVIDCARVDSIDGFKVGNIIIDGIIEGSFDGLNRLF